MEFVTGVSTNLNLKIENFLTDLFESSKLKIMNQKLVYDIYNSEGYVGLFKCFEDVFHKEDSSLDQR